MALLKENINNLIIDDLDKRNQNWTTIEDSLELKADKTYVDNKVKTDVPVGAKFTDTVYSHPASHPASMITGLPTSLPANGGNADTVGGFTVGVSVPANAKFTDTVYSHPTTAGNKHIPTGGASGQILRYSASGTAIWDAENDTITTINGKTGAIAKTDIVALGIPAQDTVVDISGKADKTYVDSQNALKADIDYVNGLAFGGGGEGTIDVSHKADITYVDSQDALKADKTYVDSKVQTDVPPGAKFTDTITTINGKTGTIAKADIVALGIPAQDTVYTHPTGTNPHGTTKSDVGLSNVDNIKQMPIRDGILENYREKLNTVSASGGSINLILGNVFQHTPSGNITYSITNAISGQAQSFTLIVNMGSTVRTLTFPASVKWQGGEIPDLTTANKTYVLTFMSVNGGTTWFGMFGGEF